MAVTQLEARTDFLATAEALPAEQNRWLVLLRRFSRHRPAVVSTFLVLFFGIVFLFARAIAPFSAVELELGNVLAKPLTLSESGRMHWLGTDHVGRDFFSRILYAGRISLTVALTAVLGASVFGAIYGAISGYFKGRTDDAMMRFVEFLLTIPTLPILLILSSILIQSPDLVPIPAFVLNGLARLLYIQTREAQQVVMVIIVLMSFGWLTTARLMRGMVLSLRELEFTDAAACPGGLRSAHYHPAHDPQLDGADHRRCQPGPGRFCHPRSRPQFPWFRHPGSHPYVGKYALVHAELHVPESMAALDPRIADLPLRVDVQLYRRWLARRAGSSP